MTSHLPNPLVALLTGWRAEAALFRRRGQESLAVLIDSLAGDVETFWRTHVAETLTLEQASKECGYSPDHIGRLVRKGQLPNASTKGRPRVRRGDLPPRVARFPGAGYDPDADALNLLNRRGSP